MQFKVGTAVASWQIWLTLGDSSLIPDVLTRLHKLDTPHYFEFAAALFIYRSVYLIAGKHVF